MTTLLDLYEILNDAIVIGKFLRWTREVMLKAASDPSPQNVSAFAEAISQMDTFIKRCEEIEKAQITEKHPQLVPVEMTQQRIGVKVRVGFCGNVKTVFLSDDAATELLDILYVDEERDWLYKTVPITPKTEMVIDILEGKLYAVT